MKQISRKIVGRNVKNLRLMLGLSQYNFALLVNLSKATIINIESAYKGYNLNLLDKISHFSDYSVSELFNENFIPDFNIREKLIEKFNNQPEYKILVQQPELVYAITHKLLGSVFFDTPKEIKQIRKFFEDFDWYYNGTSISTALKRKCDFIKIQNHSEKKNTHVYSKNDKAEVK